MKSHTTRCHTHPTLPQTASDATLQLEKLATILTLQKISMQARNTGFCRERPTSPGTILNPIQGLAAHHTWPLLPGEAFLEQHMNLRLL